MSLRVILSSGKHMKLSQILINEFGERPHLDLFFGERYDAHRVGADSPRGDARPHTPHAEEDHVKKACDLLKCQAGERNQLFTVDMNDHAAFGDFMRAAGLRFAEFGEHRGHSGSGDDVVNFYGSKRRPGVVMMEHPKTGHMTFFYSHGLMQPVKESLDEAKKTAKDDDDEPSSEDLPNRFFAKGTDAYRFIVASGDPKMQQHAHRVFNQLFGFELPKQRKVYAIEASTNQDLYDEMGQYWARAWQFPAGRGKKFDQYWLIKKHKTAPIYRLATNDGKRVVYWYPVDIRQS